MIRREKLQIRVFKRLEENIIIKESLEIIGSS